ncbi:MAG TPA: L-threonylcarbamoyladenylate synthase [Chryseosolibacter sp.]|nr:L-threonylcarbamoyladenylate synthase [Chryseosolibacter sp.]
MADRGKDINKAKELLEKGELVAIPTETVYGLAANALDADAVLKIFQVKNRPQFDPLIIHISAPEKVRLYAAHVPLKAEALAAAFWPGPLTLLLEKQNIIPDLVTAGLPTVGIRCPDHPLTHGLLESISFPLAAPSANPFGYISPTTPAHVEDQLGSKIHYILDGGPCRIGLESTIVGFDNEGAIVFRTGGLTIEDIEKVAGRVRMQLTTSSNPLSPGQLHSHYAPKKKLLAGNLEELMSEYEAQKVGVLSFQKDRGVRFQYILSPSGNPDEAARNFFSGLRSLDASPVEVILAEYVPEAGLGKAINDRLRRASSGK